MLTDFAVLVVALALLLRLRFGSIGVLQSISTIASASGKNFIYASVERLGGDGATIARLMNLPIELPIIVMKIAISITIASLVTFKQQHNRNGLARDFW
jgi:hypothetical protein